jgi:hypothetical protein
MGMIQLLDPLRPQAGPKSPTEDWTMADEFPPSRHLVKSFGPTQVVKDVNLSFEKGEFVSCSAPRAAARPRSCA